MTIAYIISAYKLPRQLTRLVRILLESDCQILIHLDKKSRGEDFDRATSSLQKLDRVHLLPRHTCHWGDFGHVRASLKGIEWLSSHNLAFDYAVLLTGQDYPIKSSSEIQRYFEEDRQRQQFIQHYPIPRDDWRGGGLERIECWHFRLCGKRFQFPGKHRFGSRLLDSLWYSANRHFGKKREFPRKLKPYGGSSYWTLSRDCIFYLNDFVRDNPAYLRFFKYVLIPDEIFFHTILANSPFKSALTNDNLRFMDWSRTHAAEGEKARPPAVLTSHDLPQILASSALFARKFDTTVDSRVLDRLDEQFLDTSTL